MATWMQTCARHAWLIWVFRAVCLAAFPGCQTPFVAPWAESVEVGPNPLETARMSPDPRAQVQALQILAQQAGGYNQADQAQIVGELAALFNQAKNPYLKVEIVRTLNRYPGPRVEEVLANALTDAHQEVRVETVRAWTNRRSPHSVGALIRAYESEDNLDVRLEALRGLGTLGGDPAVNTLAQALHSSDPAIQFRAVQSLSQATNLPYGNDIGAWKAHFEGRPVPPPSVAQRWGFSIFR